jgi:hypothetical protein
MVVEAGAGPAAAPPRRAATSSSSSSSSSGFGQRAWELMTTGLWALLTLWRLAIAKVNATVLAPFLDHGMRRRTDFLHKVMRSIVRMLESIDWRESTPDDLIGRWR